MIANYIYNNTEKNKNIDNLIRMIIKKLTNIKIINIFFFSFFSLNKVKLSNKSRQKNKIFKPSHKYQKNFY